MESGLKVFKYQLEFLRKKPKKVMDYQGIKRSVVQILTFHMQI